MPDVRFGPSRYGDLPSDDARRHDDCREDEEDGAGTLHSELARVEGGERAEVAKPNTVIGEDEAGPDAGGMDEA